MKTILHNLLELSEKHSSAEALKYYRNGSWQSWTWSDFSSRIDELTAAILNLKLKKHSRIAIFSETRVEWSVTDWAIMSTHSVTVPIYHNSQVTEVKYILDHSQAEVIFLENRACFKVWNQIKDQCPKVKKVIAFDYDDSMGADAVPYQDFLVEGAQTLPDLEKEIIHRRKSAKADDWATLIYTSGTTGVPKGVVLNHSQISSEVNEAFQMCGVNSEDVSLSFLPYAHVLGRVEHWAHIVYGYTLCFAQSIEKLRLDLKVIKPTIM
ncbi:MAG: AMP-binding protein, partial [Bdellovibrionota bacterium]